VDTTNLLDLADPPKNADDLPRGEADDRKEHHVPAPNEDQVQGTPSADAGPDPTVEELAAQLQATVDTSESSNDDAHLDDADQLPEGVTVDDDGTVRYRHPILDREVHLAPNHWRELVEESSIDPALVIARGYVTMDGTEVERKFLRKHGIPPRALTDEAFPGLLLIVYGPNPDQLPTMQWKPAQPVIDAKGKAQKYLNQTGKPNRLDVHPLRRDQVLDHDRPLWFTEGTKKADALASRDLAVVGLAGVWNWRPAGKRGRVIDWDDLPVRDREVVICYDADGRDKVDVRRASAAFGTWLAETKHARRVRYLFVPEAVNGTKVKGVDEYLAAGGTVDQLLDASTLEPPAVESDASDEFTDARLAERVAEEVLAGRYIWSPALDWLTWDGRRWSPCSDATAREAVRQWALRESSKVLEDAKRTGKYPDREVLAGWLSALSRGRLSAILDLARGIVEVAADELDADPDVMNTPAGVVDLRTGKVLDHDPALLMTRITSGNYRPGFTHPDWTAALDALDEPERRWLQRRLGQGVTGHPTPNGILPVLQGSGENGKSAITTDGAVPALGDYASMASAKLFSKGNEHSEEMASLRGKRLLIAEELAEGRSIDVTSLKRIQDVGLITARHVYQRNMTFPASHSLFTTTNYVPVVNEVDHGTWRRLALLRFPYTFRKPGEELETPNDRRGDPRLKPRIKANRDHQHDAIVTWIVEGALAWHADPDGSLALTPRMEADKHAWRVEADRILGFWDEYLVPDPDRCILTTETLATFNNWLRSNGHNTWPRETFGPRFIQHHETARHRIEKRRQLNPAGLDRTPDPIGRASQVPRQAEVYRGVRWRTDDDPGPEGGSPPPPGKLQGLHGSQELSRSSTRTGKVPEGSATSATAEVNALDQDQPPTTVPRPNLDDLDLDQLPTPGGPSECCQGPSLIIREGRWIKRACLTCDKRHKLREVTAL
jgi:putative DNA primase/helicase